MKKLLEKTSFILVLAALLGFLFPNDLSFLLPYLLFFMLTLSLRQLVFHKLSKHERHAVFWLILLNFFVLSPLLILLTILFVENPMFRYGFFLIAAMPPAVGVVSLTYLFHGDLKEAMIAEIFSYLFSLIFAPLLVFILIGDGLNIWLLLRYLLLVVLLPLIASRFIHKSKLKVFKYTKIIVNMLFGLGIYILVGLNRDILFNLKELWPVILVTIISFVVVPTILFFSIKRKNEKIVYALFSFAKNGGLAAVIAIALFSPVAAVPATVRALFGILVVIYLEILEKKFVEKK